MKQQKNSNVIQNNDLNMSQMFFGVFSSNYILQNMKNVALLEQTFDRGDENTPSGPRSLKKAG